MSQLTAIKGRIKTIANLHKVTNAMEMVTRTRIHKIRQNFVNAKNYQELSAKIFAVISAQAPGWLYKKSAPAAPEKYYLAFFSHKGFCGGFNDKLLQELRLVLRGNPAQLYMLGRPQARWKHYLRREYQHIPAEEKTYQAETAGLLAELQAKILSGANIEIYYVYNRLISVLEQTPVVQKIYPAELPAPSGEVLLEPDADTLYPEALKGYLAACLDRAYWESAAGEYYSRLLSMKNANDNAEIILNTLQIQYSKTRQMRITQELSEVVSAFDVLRVISAKRMEGV